MIRLLVLPDPRLQFDACCVLHAREFNKRHRDGWVRLLLDGERDGFVRPRGIWTLRSVDLRNGCAGALRLLADRAPRVVEDTLRELAGEASSDGFITKASLQSSSWQQRREAVQALAALSDEASMQALDGALQDSSEHVRHAAVVALANRGPAAVPSLVRIFNTESNAWVRASALSALSGLDAVDAPFLEQLLLDAPFAVRIEALRALERLRDPVAKATLEALESDTEVHCHLRKLARKALDALVRA